MLSYHHICSSFKYFCFIVTLSLFVMCIASNVNKDSPVSQLGIRRPSSCIVVLYLIYHFITNDYSFYVPKVKRQVHVWPEYLRDFLQFCFVTKVTSYQMEYDWCIVYQCVDETWKVMFVQCFSYPDLVLASLLGIRAKYSSRKLQVKVNDVLFVGFPVQMSASSTGTCNTTLRSSPVRECYTTASFNTVFALDVCISY